MMAAVVFAGFGDPEFWRKLVERFFESDTRSVLGDFRIQIAAAVGFGAGIYWFFKGLWTFRKYRVIEDTPQTPIRSIAMGLVDVQGKAVGDPPITSPITRTPCFFYQVKIEKWTQTGDKPQDGVWRHYKTDAGGKPFTLEDPTGKVLVDAHGADFDLTPSDNREIGDFSRFFVPSVEADDPVIDPEIASTFEASDREVLMYITKAAGKSGLLSGRYRVTEYCIEPEQSYDVTGTCTENPGAKDEHDRNLIRKGTNEPTFVISMDGKVDLESTLRYKALRGVLGGGLLAVGCLWFLLMHFGWL
ncbi:MAG TPA: hypothetical protein VG204_17370 [Terriglobia bacterium]|nr:hypothetical protein [Terriglobia bacterium]